MTDPHRGLPDRPDRATVLRYAGLQLPGFTFVSLAAAAAVEWLGVASHWAIVGVVAWVAKDAAMFPFVWRAYAERKDGGLHEIRGREGVSIDALAPEGRVRVGSESWRARSAGNGPIAAGTRIRVVDVDGLRLTVEPAHPASADTDA